MNIVYKILWIDDSDDFIESAKELIEQKIEANHMVPDIKPYSSFKELQKEELENFDENTFNMYDQILVDFALSGSTGDEIIKDLRSREIYTDIVFYSSNYDSMLKAVKNKGQLDGVFFARRENLTSVINNVVKKNIKRESCIANVRGIIMDGTSEFDYDCKMAALALFERLKPDDKRKIFNNAKEYVERAKKKASNNFKKLEKKSEKGMKEYMEECLSSVFYIMDNKDRYEIMAMIIGCFDEFSSIFDESFVNDYSDNLIKPRNELAHSKLYYGECGKKLHIAKRRGPLTCNKECDNCISQYDIKRCDKIRADIYKYYIMFSNLTLGTKTL